MTGIPAPGATAALGKSSGDSAIALASCGPADHGITRTARQIADAARKLGFGGEVLDEPDPARVGDLVDRLSQHVRLVHLHLNDWLFADRQTSADRRIGELVSRLRRRGVALSVTLHDLPQVSDGPELFGRRANSYRAFVRQADGVVVSSEHERSLLTEALSHVAKVHDAAVSDVAAGDVVAGDVAVIPLPLDSAPPGGRPPPRRDIVPTIGIFGYLYPGKGHVEVLEELSGMQPAVTVLAIGRPSGRHAGLLPELQAVAERGGINFRCTGYIPEADVLWQLRDVLIPVAPHTHISASGSINSWIAAGRRPLVPAGRYVTELDRRMPGAVSTYQPGQLRGAVERAIADPDTTWLPTGFRAGPTTSEVASGYLGWLRRKTSNR